MRFIRLLRWVLVVTVLTTGGCKGTPSMSTKTDSSTFGSLQEKVDFLQRYVKFRRTYTSLDFSITYQDNSGGMVPGPSDWDIRLVATVPAAEMGDWIPPGADPTPQDRSWLDGVPTSVDVSGINEWYRRGNMAVGLDRERRIVAYRNWTE